MVTRDTAWPVGTPCWIDLGVADIPRAIAFYEGLFSWVITPGPPETGGYAMCELDGRPVAGIGPKMGPPDAPTVWTTYLATDDADVTAAKIKAAGGQLLMEPFDVMDVGRMAVVVDPSGAAFGIWEARSHTGIQLANEPGSLIWSENMSRDYDGNKAFYQAVFGYSFGDIGAEGMRYATLDLGGRPVGGIGEISADQPADTSAHWSTYFAVRDTDASLARVTGLGGAVVAPPWDSPYGRMAVVSDNQGAVFSVMSVAPESES
ncbi:MAG: VOC family protein [Streptosporangiaceae bacterium]